MSRIKVTYEPPPRPDKRPADLNKLERILRDPHRPRVQTDVKVGERAKDMTDKFKQ